MEVPHWQVVLVKHALHCGTMQFLDLMSSGCWEMLQQLRWHQRGVMAP